VQIPAVNNPAPGDWAYVMMEVNWRLYLATLIEQSNLAWQEEYWVEQGYALNWGDGSAPQGQWVPGDGLPIGSDSSGRPSFPMTYGMTWDCGYGAAFGSGAPSLMDYFSGVYQIQPTLPDSSDMIYLNPGWGDGWNPAGQTMTAGGSMSGTNNQFMAYQGNTLRMQDDGNFVLYPSSGGVQWASNTQGNPGAHLDMQDDCNLVIYGSSGAIWSSNTGGYSGQQCVATLSSTTRSSGINLYVYNITTGTVLFDSSQVNWNSGMTPTQTSQGNNPYQYDLSY
jgi:hypothetical protein